MSINLGLERIRELVLKTSLNSNLNIFHVAGTNGKGSTCTYIESILRQANFSTLKFTSPHLITPNDAIQYNQKPIAIEMYTDLMKYVRKSNERLKLQCTEFELTTAVAFKSYELLNPDYGVFEVGLGGRLDATNILKNSDVVCSAITNISIDHESFLGSNLAAIAKEKGGIIKPQVPVVIDGSNCLEVKQVLTTIAQTMNSKAYFTNGAPEIVQNNQQIAKVVIQKTLPQISNEKIETALANAKWPGRMQFLNSNLLVDGAHNPAAAIKLRREVSKLGKPVRWVLGFSKPAKEIMEILVEPQDSVILVEFEPVEGMPWIKPQSLNDLRAIASTLTNQISTYPVDNLPAFDGLTVVCGSLYLVGQFLNLNS